MARSGQFLGLALVDVHVANGGRSDADRSQPSRSAGRVRRGFMLQVFAQKKSGQRDKS
jgi:hypothetical protein